MKSTLRFLPLLVAALLCSCAAEKKPAIVLQVELAPTPVQSVEIASNHLWAVFYALEKRVPTMTTSTEISGAIGSLADAVRAFDASLKRLLTLNSVTRAEDAKLKALFHEQIQADEMKRLERMVETLIAKGEKHAGDGILGNRAREFVYWAGELEGTMNKVQRTPFVVR